MQEIDEMDLLYFLRVLGYGARMKDGDKPKDESGRDYIDNVWLM